MSLEVTRQAAGDLFPWGFYALRLGGLGLQELQGTSPAGVRRKIFISLPLSHSLKPLGFKLERFLKG